MTSPAMTGSLRRYSVFYFFYFAAIGAYTPYVGRWVDALGHSGYVVGAMLGLWYGSRIVSPPAWAALTGRSASPGHWLVAGSLVSLLFFAGFSQVEQAWPLLAVMLGFGLFYNALMPQFEAMTLNALRETPERYGRIRVWGSVGFVLVAASFGRALDHWGSRAFPWLALPLLAAVVAAAWSHRAEQQPRHGPATEEAGQLWKRPGVRRFLLMALLMQAGFGPFYVFFTLHLQANGHNGTTVGLLWAVGVVIEILLFWHAPRFIARFGASRLLSVCLAVTVGRWLLTAVAARSLPLMVLAQASHALSFAMFHACCMRLMSDFFPGRHAATGQSLLYGFSSGIGGVVGAAVAAIAWEAGGGRLAFFAAAIMTALAWLVYVGKRRPQHV